MLKATVSGSFHRHMSAIYGAVHELFALGVNVLSPADPQVVDFSGEFLFVASDKLRSIKLVQSRHFEAIRESNFLWIVCPDGYTGVSTSAEIGAAYMAGTPVFADHPPLDITIQEFVTVVPSMRAVVDEIRSRKLVARPRQTHVLLDPETTIENSIRALDQLTPLLTQNSVKGDTRAENGLKGVRRTLKDTFGITSR